MLVSRTLVTCNRIRGFRSAIRSRCVCARSSRRGISAPTYSLTDPNGINLVSNKPNARLKDVLIGDEQAPTESFHNDNLRATQSTLGHVDPHIQRQNLAALLSDPSTNCAEMNSIVDVSIAGAADRMCGTAGGAYISQRSSGGSMTTNGDGTLTYTDREGTRYSFAGAWLAQIASPDGRIATLTYKIGNVGPGVSSYAMSDSGMMGCRSSTPTRTNSTSQWVSNQLASGCTNVEMQQQRC